MFTLQEHEGFSSPLVAVPTRMTKKGFPTVHQLDFSALKTTLDVSAQSGSSSQVEAGGTIATTPAKKKSLFAQQLEQHGLEYFGVEVNEGDERMTQAAAFKKDYVEPVSLGGSVLSPRNGSVVKEGGAGEGAEGQSAEVAGGGQDMEVECGRGVVREEFESGASQAWEGLVMLHICTCTYSCRLSPTCTMY